MKRSLFVHACRGMGHLPICGSHPGAPLGIGMGIALGGIAIGSSDSWVTLAIGLGIAAIFPGMMILGAIERSRTEDRFARAAPTSMQVSKR